MHGRSPRHVFRWIVLGAIPVTVTVLHLKWRSNPDDNQFRVLRFAKYSTGLAPLNVITYAFAFARIFQRKHDCISKSHDQATATSGLISTIMFQ